MSFINLEDSEFLRYTNMILYGASGVGKTYISSSAAEVGDVIYLNFEGKGVHSIPKKYRPRIDVFNIASYEELQKLFDKYFIPHMNAKTKETIIKLEKDIKGKDITTPRDYKFIVFDSLHEMQKLARNHYSKRSTKDIFGDKTPQIQDWQRVGTSVELLVNFVNNLNITAIYVVGLEKEKDAISGKMMLQPLMQGQKLLPSLLGAVDNILYLAEQTDKGKQIKYIQTKSSDKTTAKNRLNLPPILRKITIKEILQQGGLLE